MFEIEASTVVDQSSNKWNDFNFFFKKVLICLLNYYPELKMILPFFALVHSRSPRHKRCDFVSVEHIQKNILTAIVLIKNL